MELDTSKPWPLPASQAPTSTSTDCSPPADGLDLADDTPLAPACNLAGDGTCESCQ